MSHFYCNLSEVNLNLINPLDKEQQEKCFRASSLIVSSLLHHKFINPKHRYSREIDPIVAVCITGITDFFVNLFGVNWLLWWKENRRKDYPKANIFIEKEKEYFTWWKSIVKDEITKYCNQHNLKIPIRYTAVQPSGTKSLLVGASPGVHFHKATRYIRRITFRRDDPVALACIDYGYNVVPSQSCKDENGQLLDNAYDERVNEWLIEIPCEVSWAEIADNYDINISHFSFKAQFDFYKQVQNYWTTHNCFSRETSFLTAEGIKTFTDFKVGDKVTVLNGEGNWVSADIVRTNDLRDMYEIKLKQGKTGKIKTITATGCHRFPVKRISGGNTNPVIRTTLELKIGHRLVTNTSEFFNLDEEGIKHGLVFGDGSKYKNKKGEYIASQLYLCGNKRDLVKYFDSTERIIERDDINQTRIYGLPLHYKELPVTICSQSYLAGFFAGLFATDGNISKSCLSISSSDEHLIDFLNSQLPRLGIIVSSYTWNESTTGYSTNKLNCKMAFTKESVPANLILREPHQEILDAYESQPCQWRVVSVNKLPEQQYGWCVMEPETNKFTLTDNILTMNTSVTFEYRESEINEVTDVLYDDIYNNVGFVSGAMGARFDDYQAFPRLPFEPITKEQYYTLSKQVLERRVNDDFKSLVDKYYFEQNKPAEVIYSTACDGQLCELKGI